MNSGYPLQRTRLAGCARFRPPVIVLAPRPAARGFTVVELVTVIVLLSILAVAAISRMASPDLFAPAIVTQALVAETRFAQQTATSRHDAVVSLTVDRAGADWRFRVGTDVDGVVRTELVEAEDTTVQATSGAANGGLGAGAALLVTFDRAGDLSAVTIAGAAGDPAGGVALTVTGDSTRQVCIYPRGYANDDACI